MRLENHDKKLLEILNSTIREFEKIEDDPETLNFVARRLGNIVKHMKDLRDDLRPRSESGSRSKQAVEPFHTP